MIKIIFLIFFLFPVIGFPEVDQHSIFTDLLKKNVNKGVVSYKGFKDSSLIFKNYLELLGTTDPDKLTNKARMAFYINAYNACTIQLILTKYPKVQSIKDFGGLFSSPWKKKTCNINNELVTLDHIEHGILRKDYNDPRIHFAVNCASKSCPPLLNEAYSAQVLDHQLNKQTREFINDKNQTYLIEDILYISKIFDWFEEDFGDIKQFIQQYAEEDLKQKLINDNYKIKHTQYDWSLNGN